MRFQIDPDNFHDYFESTENEERLDRPYNYSYISSLPALTYYYYVKDELFNWFIELNIGYSIGYHSQGKDVSKDIWNLSTTYDSVFLDCYWYIDIEDENKAMLFKLTWF